MATLRDAVARLRADNAVVAEEQRALETQISTLSSYSQLSQQLDERLTSYLDELGETDPSRADILTRDLLFEVRQRRTTILTQLTVTMQGKAALGIVEENNRELIEAITSATSSTLGALQTGATVRQALEMRRHLQTGLGESIKNRDQAEAETLQQAWADVGETLNQVERLRRRLAESTAILARADMR